MKVTVIGAGLFGATIAHALVRRGDDVTVVDDFRPMSGSRPSGCLMKPGWFSGLGSGVYDPALQKLEEIYGIQQLDFQVWPTGLNARVMRIEQSIEGLHVVRGTVHEVRDATAAVRLCRAPLRCEEWLEADMLVVAAGAWCSKLMQVDGLSGKVGVSFTWPHEEHFQNFIRPWAPFKQVVAYKLPLHPDRTGRIWVGDGSAILEKNWDEPRRTESLKRCAALVGKEPMSVVSCTGIRPFHKMKPCLLERRGPTWLATGGAKNGTIAAGWCAHRISETP